MWDSVRSNKICSRDLNLIKVKIPEFLSYRLLINYKSRRLKKYRFIHLQEYFNEHHGIFSSQSTFLLLNLITFLANIVKKKDLKDESSLMLNNFRHKITKK